MRKDEREGAIICKRRKGMEEGGEQEHGIRRKPNGLSEKWAKNDGESQEDVGVQQ